MSEKKWSVLALSGICGCLVIFGLIIVIVDPCFHYHKPIDWISYEMKHERYDNVGMIDRFEYTSVIIGTSMTQNFKISEYNELFSTNAIKIPFAGAGYNEISRNLERALQSGNEIETVLWGLDFDNLLLKWDWEKYDELKKVQYLYDDNIINDVSYVLNKTVMLAMVAPDILRTLQGKPDMTFDEYDSWEYSTGKEAVFAGYYRPEGKVSDQEITEEEREQVEETIQKNVISVIEKYPDIKFYIFITPYSIGYWDRYSQRGDISKYIAAEKIALELILAQENVELYCFFENEQLITDFNNYKDISHYSADINSEILQWISNGEYRITSENYLEHIKNEQEFFLNYDYENIFE